MVAATIGTGTFTYDIVRDWAKLPQGWALGQAEPATEYCLAVRPLAGVQWWATTTNSSAATACPNEYAPGYHVVLDAGPVVSVRNNDWGREKVPSP